MSTRPVDTEAAQSPGPNPNPSESDGRSTSDNDVRTADVSEVDADDPDVAGDDASKKPS